MNQLISTADTAGNEQSYSYDKRGNLTKLYKNGELANEHQFGALNRLEQALNHETGQGATYRYNGFGHRVGQSIGDTDLNPAKHIDDVLDMTRNFNNLLQRREDDISTSYIWDASLLAGVTADGVYNGYLLDEQGSPTRLMRDGGTADMYGFDEFGNTLHGTPSTTQPFGFTGYRHDPIAGTWFAQSREYDSQTGRFTAKDLNRYMDKGIVQSLNMYQYCHGNPVRYIDPMGFDLCAQLERLFPDSDLNQNAGSDDPVQISISGNVVTIDVLTNAASGVTTFATTGVSTVISIANSYVAHQSAVRVAMQSIEDYNLYFHIDRLGGNISYTNINGQLVVHGISYYNNSARQRADRFICSHGLNISREELRAIVLSGNADDESRQIYNDYMDFISHRRYARACCDDYG